MTFSSSLMEREIATTNKTPFAWLAALELQFFQCTESQDTSECTKMYETSPIASLTACHLVHLELRRAAESSVVQSVVSMHRTFILTSLDFPSLLVVCTVCMCQLHSNCMVVDNNDKPGQGSYSDSSLLYVMTICALPPRTVTPISHTQHRYIDYPHVTMGLPKDLFQC